jgi:hypothetical protein
MFVSSNHLTQRDVRLVPASARIGMAPAPSSVNAAFPPPGSFPASKRKPTPKPATARFTPQQAEDSPANQISMRFDPGPTPKYSCSTILKPPTLHPRKPSSRLANLRLWIRSQPHIPTATDQLQNQPQNQRRPGSPHSKQKTLSPAKYQCKSTLDLPQSAAPVPF